MGERDHGEKVRERERKIHSDQFYRNRKSSIAAGRAAAGSRTGFNCFESAHIEISVCTCVSLRVSDISTEAAAIQTHAPEQHPLKKNQPKNLQATRSNGPLQGGDSSSLMRIMGCQRGRDIYGH